MKKLIIASGLLALLAAATSCDKYDIYDEQYGKVLLIKDGGDKEYTVYSTDDFTDLPITVMKGGHSPEETATCQLRVMNADEFGDYLEENYGDRNFKGLAPIDIQYYKLRDNEGNVVTEIEHKFTGSSDRYFNASLRIYSEAFADWQYGLSWDDQTHYVIPIGLYSDQKDSINEYNKVLIVEPKAVDPTITCSIANDNFQLDELSRRTLLNQQGKPSLVEGLGKYEVDEDNNIWYSPEVYFSMPCKNLWGLKVAIESGAKATVYNYNGAEGHTTSLTFLPNDRWELGESVVFPGPTVDEFGNEVPGVTKVRVPLKINLSKIDPNGELNKNFVVPIKVNGKRNEPAISWLGTAPDEKIVNRLTIANTTFFTGIVVKETPLEITADDVTSNDCETSEGSIAALFDDDLSTFFHSTWSKNDVERPEPYGSYLEIALPEPIDECYFSCTTRNNGNSNMPPKTVDLYVAVELASDPEETRWEYFCTVKNPKKLGPGETFEIGKIDKMFRHTHTFRFMRFCVLDCFDKSGQTQSTVGMSSATSCWNLAELRVYGRIHTDDSGVMGDETEE